VNAGSEPAIVGCQPTILALGKLPSTTAKLPVLPGKNAISPN